MHREIRLQGCSLWMEKQTMSERYLTFALGKGRLAKKTLELFEKIGITCEEMKDKDTRKLIFVNEEAKLRFFLSKGPDVPTYVARPISALPGKIRF